MRAGLVIVLLGLSVVTLLVAWRALDTGVDDDAGREAEPQRQPPAPPKPAELPASADPRPVRPARLMGRPLPPAPQGPTKEAQEALDAQTVAYEEAQALHEHGRLSLVDLRRVRMELLEAKYDAKRIDKQALHARRAELFAEELADLEILVASGAIPQIEVEQARVHVAYEQYRAGQPKERYARAREGYLQWLRDRSRVLEASGRAPPGQVQEDLKRAEGMFPNPDGLDD